MSGSEPAPAPNSGPSEGADEAELANSETEAEVLVVFATSTRQPADLGGPEGADELCAARAAEAALDGTFMAWLSTANANVSARFHHSTGPYVLTDGTRIADDWGDLTDGDLLVPISLDETGASVSGDVWTGTLPGGSAAPLDDCGGFTVGDSSGSALCGNSNSENSAWTENLTPRCSLPLRVYCFQQ